MKENIVLIVLALLSIGVGLGVILSIIWKIITKILLLKNNKNQLLDIIFLITIVSAVISRIFLEMGNSIKCDLIIAVGAGLGSALFFLINK